MRKNLLTLLLFLMVACNVSGQSSAPYYVSTVTGTYIAGSSATTIAGLPDWYQNLQKYWFYRYRLVNDFTFIGPNPGESLVAQIIPPLRGLYVT